MTTASVIAELTNSTQLAAALLALLLPLALLAQAGALRLRNP
ncbi:MAG: hypothetical protein RIC16_11970 [Rhodospirillales bacterium]